MTGRLVGQLNDVFPQVRFDGLDAVSFEVWVDRHFLADHRLALGDGLGVNGPA